MRRHLWTVVLLFCWAVALAAQSPYPHQEIRFGVRVTPDQWPALVQTLKAHPADPANPVGVTLMITKDWAQSPDWGSLDDTVRAVDAARARLCIATKVPDAPGSKADLTYLTTLSEHAGPRVDALGLSLSRSQFSSTLQSDPDRLALVLKEMTVALRGQTGATILLGEVEKADLPIMKPLYSRDFRAYVEGYSSDAVGPTGEPSDEVVKFLQTYHLGAPLLLHLPRMSTAIGAQLLVLLSASRDAVYTDIEPADVGTIWTALLELRKRITPHMGPGYATQATSISDASGPRTDIGIINLLDATKMIQGMVLVPRVANSKPGPVDIKLPTADLTNPEAWPLPDGKAVKLGYDANQRKQETVLHVPWPGKAVIVLFSRLKTGTVGEQKVDVTTAYRIPVEVILARHQAVQEPQSVFLDNYRRSAEVDYHFKLPGGTGSLDVTFMNTFYYEKGSGARWVQNRLLINGVDWKGKKIPQLPIVEPEKVNTLPLALTLGRDYSYRYIKNDRVDGHDCYEVEFIPRPDARGSLYSGKVWIDRKSYQKIRMTVTQTGLQPPMVSNEETDFYAPYKGPDGKTYWLLSKVRGQQIFALAGAQVVGEREISFGTPELNDPQFNAQVAKAEASDKPILQETDKGLRYLVKQKDGSRKLEMQPETSKLFGAAGFYYDKSLSYPLPIVGVDYFNYNWRKTHTQVNMLIGGAVNTLTVSKVDLFPKIDGTLNAVIFALPFQDKYYPTGVEDKSQRVKILREITSGSLGWRFNQFSKLSLRLSARYYRYSSVSETASDFRMPKNHFDLSLGLGYDFAWRGWSATASFDRHKRTSWEIWGLPGQNRDFARYKDYDKWDASFSKTFYLPYFQKISTSLTWLDGRDLDRFSQYEFSYLGAQSLAGFSGSGVRFDRGAIASLGYQFNVANIIRFGVNVDHARVEPLRSQGLWQNHTGLGLSGTVAGPWQTLWTVDLGYAVKSDIPAVQHDYTAALLVLKLW